MGVPAMSVEQLVWERRNVLLRALAGIVIWQGLAIVRHAFPALEKVDGLPGSLRLLEFAGLILFLLAMWRMWQLGKQMQGRPSIFAAFNDERVEQNCLLAWRSAMWAMVFLQSVWIALLAFFPQMVPPLVVAETTLLVGTTVGIAAFLRRDTE